MARRKKGEAVSGWVVVDKPVGPTSSDVVNRIRRAFNAQKAGHAGTLDPLASGILPVALGEATKTVPFMIDAAKGYRFTIRFGEATTTHDAEGEVTETSPRRPSDAEIEAGFAAFRGEIQQVPPAFSAIKIDGERAYARARAGEEVVMEARPVTIHEIALLGRPDTDHAELEILCSKGTYVRSLARDLALALGTVGHVSALRRTRHGPFREEAAIPLDKLCALGHIAPAPGSGAHLLPLETALDDIPALAVSGDDAARLRKGQGVLLRGRDAPILSGSVLATHRGDPVALTEYRQGELCPVRVFNLGS
ncbi:tRNA pseudouridine synthase B [Parvibaculum lavamentivorans DS-1]|uniref:tRNA pseudouridine synthase B n=1 Tax=Parvibaculum lavamentivorans (strain DS-1 / DSM 13023 / NCIMB 13966) TaxID=402881 RepID=A7HZ95_PARL1|nr:tRNA pseudouridine(55) synthase TruB [Parvibaculum lavamentivorans]ABS65228.1 tRNA pseudouridine synthase B [Parvibaculum lavamentivorans DS-1]